jgi:hypothetical protein
MADPSDGQVGTTPDVVDYAMIAEQLAIGWLKRYASGGVQKATVSAAIEAAGGIQAVAWDLIVETALLAGKGIHLLEEPFLPIIAGIVAPVLSGLFGAEIDEGAFARKLAKGGGHSAAQAIVAGFMRAIEGNTSGELTPSREGSARIASAAVAASLESSFNALVPSMLSHLFPFDLGHFTEIMELPEDIIRALGVGRLVRRALGPLVTVTCSTPMEWHVNKQYRPTLLSAGQAAQQILRGHGNREAWLEDLRRQGYSEPRIEAILNQQRKFFSPSDVRTFYSRGEWTGDQAEQHLRDQGYDADTAHDALRLEGLRRFDQLEGQEAALLVGAYASRDIDRPTFASLLNTAVTPPAERALYTELAELRRAVNIKRLSVSQVETMVRSGVLNFRDYRDAAAREGYPLEDVTALELQLRYELDKAKAIEEHRAELEAARAAEKAVKDAAAAARKAQIDAERAIARRGNEADLERAAVHGTIPISRVAEVYAAHYDDDTVGILVGELEDQRQAYIAHQAAVDDAKKRGARRNLDAGSLEQAFARSLLTAAELRGRLVAIGFDEADADLLTATAVSKKADADALAKKRADAEKAAKPRGIDLARYERLVRKGARTMPQYVALLEQLGVDEAAIPDFVDALQILIDEDAAALAERRKAAAAPPPKGLSLEQIRRGVVLGAVTEDQFQTYLVTNNYTTDAQAVLLAELRADVADAELARRRRETPAPEPQLPGSPLSTIRRAAQLGLVSPDVYIERLQRAGYRDEDIEIELELLLVEITDTQEARRRRDEPPPPTAPAGLSLAELERGVKAGVASIGQYQARAVELGKSPEEIAILAAIVEREVQTLAAARTAHDNVALRLAAGGAGIGALDAAVKDGSLDLADYVAQLEGLGVDSDEASLVGAFMAWQLESKG